MPTISRDVRGTGVRSSLRALAPGVQRGAAAAELMAVMPLLFTTVIALVWLLALATTQVRVVDAARETARVAARADSRADAQRAGMRVAPDGAVIEVDEEGAEVIAHVRAKVRGPGGLLAFLPSPTLSATATSTREDQ
jgi:Flp pilus assembly protein TadG